MKKLHALFVALLPIAALPALPAQAGLDCDNGFCVQSFYYTGTPQTFEVPEGIGAIRYEIYGASGARGGAGALAQGYLSNLPDQLIIQVGGAGGLGSFRPGGYNGGGASGGSRNNEGAGGGASDIRLTEDLQSRIVVAGGGGGGGGFAGGAGGPGGLVGGNGVDGQGLAGKGGSTTGGDAGINNSSGYLPQPGSFGVGGSGGSGLHAGGGGGGGGWYGGGGGGGDDDETGFDGGGGGGGSSYAHPDYTTNPSFEAGLNWGHGRVMLYYQMVPSVLQFSGSQVNRTEMSFDLVMNQNISNLTPQDFSFSSGTCEVNRVSINLNTANIRLRNCSDGEIGLTLNAMSVGEWEVGPLVPVTAYVDNDLKGPELRISDPAAGYSTTSLTLAITYSELIPSPDYFSVTGCDFSITPEAIELSSCSEGINMVSVNSGLAVDTWGNSGPAAQSVSFQVDLTAPTISFVTTFSGAVTFSYELLLQSSETIEIAPAAISFSSSTSCSQQVNAQSQLCGYGTFRWNVNLASISDLVGNRAGDVIRYFEIVNLEPQSVEPTQSQLVQQPAQPEPVQPTPLPPQPEPALEGPPIVIAPITENTAIESSVSESVTNSESVSVSDELAPEAETDEEALMLPDTSGPWSQFEDFLELAPDPKSVQVLESVGQTQVSTKTPVRVEDSEGEVPISDESEQPNDLGTQEVSGPPIALEEKTSFPWFESLIVLALAGLIGFGAYRTIGR
ncbi:MAG: hypothetical protein RIS08_215 [Actinomycetota bacterium]|jgi:hypothetical protein